MSNEPYSRIVVNAAGDIVMIAHLDFVSQYDSPSFTRPGCANADMIREEYDVAAGGFLPPDLFPGDGALDPIGAGTSNVLDTEGATSHEPNPVLVSRKAMLALAQSKLNILTQTDFIAALQSQIEATDAQIAAEIQAAIDAENAPPSPPPPPILP